MKPSLPTGPELKSRSEAVGYIAGTFTAIAQAIMPVRMWLLLAASGVLLFVVFRTTDLLEIARALAVYVTVVAIQLGSGVFRKQL